MRLASVVFPTPGGPQRTREGTRSSAMARRRKPFAPTTSSGPSTSSSERGRIRSASGVSEATATPSVCRGAGGISKSSLTLRPLEPLAALLGADRDPFAGAPRGQRQPPVDPGAADRVLDHLPFDLPRGPAGGPPR